MSLVDLPASLLPWIEQHCGPPRRAAVVGWEHGDAQVYRITAATPAALKIFGHGRKFAQERHAYEHWFSQLPATPTLLGAHAKPPHALLLSWEPGRPLEIDRDCESMITKRQGCFRRAGAWLRRLHELPFTDADPLPLGNAHQQRAANWLRRGREMIDPAWQGRIDRAHQRLAELDGERRVPCHRDFSPRNWLLADDGTLTIIDGEHARPDWWLADCERLIQGAFQRDPLLATAFWDGYGRQPDARERALLDELSIIQAISTVIWAREHGDEAFEIHGRRVLMRLLAQP